MPVPRSEPATRPVGRSREALPADPVPNPVAQDPAGPVADPAVRAAAARHVRPPLILLHAFPLTSALFDEVAMPPDWVVSTPDRRGFGTTPLSEPGQPAPVADLDVLVQDVIAGMDARGVERAVIGGVSMGGYVSLALLAAHPERVEGLVLADTRSTLDAPAENRGRLQIAARADAGLVASGAELLAPLLAPGADPAVRARMAALAARAAPASIAWAQRAMAARRDTTAALAAARVPVLIVVGEHDGVTPVPLARDMADAATDPTLVVIEGAGHLTPAEAPGAFARALTDWLRERF